MWTIHIFSSFWNHIFMDKFLLGFRGHWGLHCAEFEVGGGGCLCGLHCPVFVDYTTLSLWSTLCWIWGGHCGCGLHCAKFEGVTVDYIVLNLRGVIVAYIVLNMRGSLCIILCWIWRGSLWIHLCWIWGGNCGEFERRGHCALDSFSVVGGEVGFMVLNCADFGDHTTNPEVTVCAI